MITIISINDCNNEICLLYTDTSFRWRAILALPCLEDKLLLKRNREEPLAHSALINWKCFTAWREARNIFHLSASVMMSKNLRTKSKPIFYLYVEYLFLRNFILFRRTQNCTFKTFNLNNCVRLCHKMLFLFTFNKCNISFICLLRFCYIFILFVFLHLRQSQINDNCTKYR